MPLSTLRPPPPAFTPYPSSDAAASFLALTCARGSVSSRALANSSAAKAAFEYLNCVSSLEDSAREGSKRVGVGAGGGGVLNVRVGVGAARMLGFDTGGKNTLR